MATGSDIIKVASPHAVRNTYYRLGVVVPKDDANWKGPFDCAEFASWSVYQVSKKLYGCRGSHPAIADAYTGYWFEDSKPTNFGRRISVNDAAKIPGAFVLRVGAKIGHIVISDGKGGTIEAASESLGTIFGTLDNRRWDTGIIVPWIEYTENDTPAPKPVSSKIYRLVYPYMHDDKVFEIQVALRDAGFFDGKLDGVFGPYTHAAVMRFQESHRLIVDGEVGPQTLRELGLRT